MTTMTIEQNKTRAQAYEEIRSQLGVTMNDAQFAQAVRELDVSLGLRAD